MALYQSDVLEESVVEQWGTHASKKYVDKETSKKVRKASEPFLKVSNPSFSVSGFQDAGRLRSGRLFMIPIILTVAC